MRELYSGHAWDSVITLMLLQRYGTFSKWHIIQTCDKRDESQEFGRPHVLLQSRARSVVDKKGANQGFQIDDEVQERRHERHYEYGKLQGKVAMYIL
jgi:hypothetical protein